MTGRKSLQHLLDELVNLLLKFSDALLIDRVHCFSRGNRLGALWLRLQLSNRSQCFRGSPLSKLG